MSKAGSHQPTVKLTALIGQYQHTRPLRNGSVRSDRLFLEHVDLDPVYSGFRGMIQELSYDVCEMATVTFLMAMDRKKPLLLLPATVLGRYPHTSLVYNIKRGELKPSQLQGMRVGVRSHSQTSGVWMRGILENEYGVGSSNLNLWTFEDSHLAEYADPPRVRRMSGSLTIRDALLSGELDAAIAEVAPHPQLRCGFSNPVHEGRMWAKRWGVRPCNHMVVIRSDIASAEPWIPSEIYRMLIESYRASELSDGLSDGLPFGIAEHRATLDLLSFYCHQQGLISRRYKPDELFHETTRHLL
jgi:4,5-dihydroxyphthalate decarboxylase